MGWKWENRVGRRGPGAGRSCRDLTDMGWAVGASLDRYRVTLYSNKLALVPNDWPQPALTVRSLLWRVFAQALVVVARSTTSRT